MSNVVKIYNDLSDVGNHENHIKKIGIFTKNVVKGKNFWSVSMAENLT